MNGRVLGSYRKTQIFCLVFAVIAAAGCKKKPVPPAPPEVQVWTVQSGDVPIYEEWIGSLDGYVNAQIRAQVTGYLLEQHYKEGMMVKKGDLLFQIDPRPFQAALDSAFAKLAQDQAQAGKTELDVKRYTPLAKEQAISQEQLDDAVQANLAAQAAIKADEADIETARLNLGFTKIISPIDGLAGIALAQIGDLLSPSSGLLTTVSTLNPIKAYFNVSEQSYLRYWRDHINLAQDEPDLELRLILSDGSVYPLKGKVFNADRQVNLDTGTLQIVALFPNPDLVLRPGQYARVRVQTRVQHGALLVPQRAVAELQGSYQVSVVDGQNKAHVKPVKVGEQAGSNWIIEDGLKPGERVVVEGTQKAREGVEVNPKPFTPPAKPQAG
jgi:membrane fusion protein (multidrug efflux system)